MDSDSLPTLSGRLALVFATTAPYLLSVGLHGGYSSSVPPPPLCLQKAGL